MQAGRFEDRDLCCWRVRLAGFTVQKAHPTDAANDRRVRVRPGSSLTSLLQPVYLLLPGRHFVSPAFSVKRQTA